jgi:hypothetical protein
MLNEAQGLFDAHFAKGGRVVVYSRFAADVEWLCAGFIGVEAMHSRANVKFDLPLFWL